MIAFSYGQAIPVSWMAGDRDDRPTVNLRGRLHLPGPPQYNLRALLPSGSLAAISLNFCACSASRSSKRSRLVSFGYAFFYLAVPSRALPWRNRQLVPLHVCSLVQHCKARECHNRESIRRGPPQSKCQNIKYRICAHDGPHRKNAGGAVLFLGGLPQFIRGHCLFETALVRFRSRQARAAPATVSVPAEGRRPVGGLPSSQ